MKPFPVYFSLQKIQTEDVLFYFNIVKSGALLVYSLKKNNKKPVTYVWAIRTRCNTQVMKQLVGS